MPSGGARSRSGPAPQRGSFRQQKGGDWIHLPPAGRDGPTPAWPLGKATKFELETWAVEWTRPQAVMWERRGWEIQVALYVRTLRVAASPKASSATTTNLLRQMVNLGLTDDGLARLHWVIDDEPVSRSARPKAGVSARDRMTILNGGPDAKVS